MILTKFPMPPSSNGLYASFKGRFIKTVEGRRFDSSAKTFELMNCRKLDQIKAEMAKTKGFWFIDTKFVFVRSRIIGKKGQIKRLDASNRIKQTHDALARIIGVDDCLFVSGAFSKASCEQENDEQVIITISIDNMTKL